MVAGNICIAAKWRQAGLYPNIAAIQKKAVPTYSERLFLLKRKKKRLLY